MSWWRTDKSHKGREGCLKSKERIAGLTGWEGLYNRYKLKLYVEAPTWGDDFFLYPLFSPINYSPYREVQWEDRIGVETPGQASFLVEKDEDNSTEKTPVWAS